MRVGGIADDDGRTDPGIDAFAIQEGSVIRVQCKSARKEVETGLRRLADATRMVTSDPEVMRGEPVYRGH